MRFSSNDSSWFMAIICVFLLGSARAADCATAQGSAALPTLGQLASGDMVDTILASVDGEPITLRDVKTYASTQQQQQTVSASNLTSEELERLVREVVTGKLIDKEAQQSNITASDDEVMSYIDEVREQNKLDQEGFENALRARGLSMEDYQRQVKSDILKTRLVSAKVRPKVSVGEEELAKFAENSAEPGGGKKLHLHQILLKSARPDETAGLEKTARSMREQLGERATADDFKSIGGEYYEDLGLVSAADLRPELAAALRGLKTGQPTDVIQLESGYSIALVSELASGITEMNDATREKLRKDLLQRKMKQKVAEYLEKELPAKYDVEYKFTSENPPAAGKSGS